MSRPVLVFVGFVGKLPLAGMVLYNLHHIMGLQELGYDVHYVEVINRPDEAYDPGADAMTSDMRVVERHLSAGLAPVGIGPDRWSLITLDGACRGSGWEALRRALDAAEIVLAAADPSWHDEFARCERRVFIDGDPMLTQARLVRDPAFAAAVDCYTELATIGSRLGRDDCLVPDTGRVWRPTRSVVATASWRPQPMVGPGAITALLNWDGGPPVVVDGRHYGYKTEEFERVRALPARVTRACVLAVGGNAPRDRLEAEGWALFDPLAATGSLDDYAGFIGAAYCDLGVAKHAYVESRSGWFSDRSLCYLAAGRPVIHQDTGFGDWLPTGEGVFSYHTVDDVVTALEQIESDPVGHSRAARRVAEEHFEARTVLGALLEPGS